MRSLRLTWQLYGLFLAITILSLSAVTGLMFTQFRAYQNAQMERRLSGALTALTPRIAHTLEGNDLESLRTEAFGAAGLSGLRITVVNLDGSVIIDTANITGARENLANAPELIRAFQGESRLVHRPGRRAGEYYTHMAVPLRLGGDVAGAVRASMQTSAGPVPLGTVYRNGLLALAGSVLTASFVTFLITRRLSRPLSLIKAGAERLARGHLGARLPVPGSQDLAEVVIAINRLAEELESRIGTALQQRNELEAVLSSMMEGVIAVDAEARVIKFNRAAGLLFGVDPAQVVGQSIEIAVRHTELQEFVNLTLKSQTYVEAEIIVYQDGQRYLQAHGTRLHDAHGRGIGGVVALNDVTRMRRLEQARRDFVANVSHELRTPITSIKGYVETLLDGAVEDRENAHTFLDTVLRQADRLNALIEDLLTLSRVEQEAEEGGIELEPGSVRHVVHAALQLCTPQAESKAIPVTCELEDDAEAMINAQLLQQAVVNLIDNAIKYSDAGNEITVRVTRSEGFIRIEVADHGCGIAPDHLPRLFERFYRVDRARSRKQGGTGLGLAIVKHITRVHGGRVLAESKLGRGSLFAIELPAAGPGSQVQHASAN